MIGERGCFGGFKDKVVDDKGCACCGEGGAGDPAGESNAADGVGAVFEIGDVILVDGLDDGAVGFCGIEDFVAHVVGPDFEADAGADEDDAGADGAPSEDLPSVVAFGLEGGEFFGAHVGAAVGVFVAVEVFGSVDALEGVAVGAGAAVEGIDDGVIVVVEVWAAVSVFEVIDIFCGFDAI